MPTESLIIGLFVLLICGAVSFYLYVRLIYLEKKAGVMESILVDLKVAFDSLMSEHVHRAHPPAPIVETPGVQMSTPVPLESSESETVPVPEEHFYTSVLEQAHDNVEEQQVAEQPVTEEPNLDSMNRADLAALAEKKGLRVKKSMSRESILNLLRRSDKPQNEALTAGADNVPGPIGSGFQNVASLDGTVLLDGNGTQGRDASI